MPSDTCEGVFASKLWAWITNNFRLEAVLTFSHEATPFPGVDTNPIIFFISKKKPRSHFNWAVCKKTEDNSLISWVESDFAPKVCKSFYVMIRSIQEGLNTGLSRNPSKGTRSEFTLSDFASVKRGIATGANGFFLFTQARARELNIPERFLLPVVGRTRDVGGSYLKSTRLEQLDAQGRPTLLLSLDGRDVGEFPASVIDYLRQGEMLGLPNKSLIGQRNPWYKMEKRKVPPILFAYLGRRNIRFVRNLANVVPLTGFLCIYPYFNDDDYINLLFMALQDERVVENLRLVGKSYGGGAIKVEPRSLEKLPIPDEVVKANKLNRYVKNKNLELF